jgi:hypothetical protein
MSESRSIRERLIARPVQKHHARAHDVNGAKQSGCHPNLKKERKVEHKHNQKES